jgi:hypothetical protein
MSHFPPHAPPGGGQDGPLPAAQSGSKVVRPSKLAAASAAKWAASACAFKQQQLLVKNNWIGRVESPPSRHGLCYQQRRDEKARTSDDVICQRAPRMFDGGSNISFNQVAKEAKESPTPKEDGVSHRCMSQRWSCHPQRLVKKPLLLRRQTLPRWLPLPF